MSQPAKREIHVESLGAGVQSTTVYLLALTGELPRFDAAIFADTQDEPSAVYRHLSWLMTQGNHKIPIIIRSVGRLGDDILAGRDTTGQRFYAASIPAYTGNGLPAYKALGKGHRQCTREYKIRVIEQAIRRDVLGLAPRQRIPRDVEVHQYIGISTDEARRAVSIRQRFAANERKGVVHFPLLDLGWTRADCQAYLREHVPHSVERSACVFCPLKSDAEWLRLKEHDPESWNRAVEIDEALRSRPAAITNRLRLPIYLHRSARPLATANLIHSGQGAFPYFTAECEGACGV